MSYFEAELSGIGSFDGKRIRLQNPDDVVTFPVYDGPRIDIDEPGEFTAMDGAVYRVRRFTLHHINDDGVRVYREER